MNISMGMTIARQLMILILSILPVFTYSQSSQQPSLQQNYTFSYSIVEAKPQSIERLAAARNEILSKATLNGAILYAIWVAADKPTEAATTTASTTSIISPFAGLSENQMGLMFAWPNQQLQQSDAFNKFLQSIDSVTIVSRRMFEAIYLPAGLSVPTMQGFYVHREEEYKLENVDEAVRLSQEAWETWEPHWGVTVIGLFREIGITADFANLNRIVWYPSYDAWLATRSNDDRESANRFRQRRSMLIPGSGVAIATDRILP